MSTGADDEPHPWINGWIEYAVDLACGCGIDYGITSAWALIAGGDVEDDCNEHGRQRIVTKIGRLTEYVDCFACHGTGSRREMVVSWVDRKKHVETKRHRCESCGAKGYVEPAIAAR